MAPRALGALFALAAALAFAASIATSAWWAGSPTVNGHFTSAKYVHAGLLGAQGCNTGGNGACETIEVSDTLRLATYGELGAAALATLLLFLLGISAWRVGDSRKGLAKAAIVATLLAAAGGGAVLALGPALQVDPGTTVEVPFGYGLYVFAGGLAAALLGSMLALKIVPEPLRLKPGVAPTTSAAPADIRDILRADHDGIRPSQQHMFAEAPQLRPLYDAAGVPPAPMTPAVPLRAPTPLPRAQIDVLTGHATPPPMNDPRVPAPLQMPTPPAPTPAVSTADPFARTHLQEDPKVAPPMRPKPPSASPPMRAKPPSAAPPLGRPKEPSAVPFSTPIAKSASAPPRPKPPSAAPPGPKPPSVPPPAKPDLAGATLNQPKPPRAKTLGAGNDRGAKSAAVPPPARASQPALRPSAPTLAHAVPPMPTPDNQPAPSVLPAQRLATDADDSLETGMRETEFVTAVEIDHEAKAAAQHARQRIQTDARTGKQATVGDSTDTGVEIGAAPDHGPITDQQPVVRPSTPVHAPISETFPVARISEIVPAAVVPDEYASSPRDRVASPAGDKTPIPTLGPRDTNRMQTETPLTGTNVGPQTPKVPASTASPSLPPPKNLKSDATTSGPTPACPQCEAPMAWVEEHLRFYCKSCRMYF